MYTETMLSEPSQNENTTRQISNIIIRGSAPVIICYGETPPEYTGEMLTYIDTPPQYEGPLYAGPLYARPLHEKQVSIVKIKSKPIKTNPKNTENNLSNRKGKCCYSKESDDSRCCGVCYCLCPTNPTKERCECCPNTFCDFWKSGYIQTTDGPVREEDSCRECECDDCFCTLCCFPIKFPIFFPCCLGSVFNNSMNKLCGSNRNYLF
jgi:hypothetical protein